jgi:hypothetical protein
VARQDEQEHPREAETNSRLGGRVGADRSLPALPLVKVTDNDWDFLSREEAAKLVTSARSDEERAIRKTKYQN